MAEQEYTRTTPAEESPVWEAADRLRHHGFPWLAELVEEMARERSKRPDREHLAMLLTEHVTYQSRWGDGGGGFTWKCSCGIHDRGTGQENPGRYHRYPTPDESQKAAGEHVADAVLSSLALEPEAREEPSGLTMSEIVEMGTLAEVERELVDGYLWNPDQSEWDFDTREHARALIARIKAEAREVTDAEVDIDTRMLVLQRERGAATRYIGPFPNNREALVWAQENEPGASLVSSVMWPQCPEAAREVSRG